MPRITEKIRPTGTYGGHLGEHPAESKAGFEIMVHFYLTEQAITRESR